MFKFFRQYTSWLLAIFVALLMVAFLIEPSLRMFRGDAGSQQIGTLRGKKVAVSERADASNQLQMLEAISPRLASLTTQDPTHYMLMLREAGELNLSASETEVNQFLAIAGARGMEDKLPQIAARFNTTVATLRYAVRNWIIVQTYRELVLGLAHLPLQDRVQVDQFLLQLIENNNVGPATRLLPWSYGSFRVSEPALSHFVQDNAATAKITAVQVPATLYLGRVKEPDAKEVSDLFEEYKDKLPGQGKRFGLGYRTPDRVKIEYMVFPMDRLTAKSEVDEAAILSFYDAHRDAFRSTPGTSTTQPAPEAPENPTADARAKITTYLRTQKATELAGKLLKAAAAILAQDTGTMDETPEGYRAVPAGWKPMPLSKVAEQLQQQYGFLPDVHSNDNQWLTREQLVKEPGIGTSVLPIDAQRAAPLADYIFSAKEFSPTIENPLAPRRLQVGLPSQPVVNPADGTRYLFRLLAAEPAHSPKSLDDVKDQVMRDAKKIKAFEALVQDRDTYLKKLEKESLKSLADELKVSLVEPPAFHRREMTPNMGFEVPEVPGIGKDRAFVDRVFELARDVMAAGGLEKATLAQRIAALPVDSRMSLFLVHLDSYEPMTQSEYKGRASSPEVPSSIYQSLMSDEKVNALSVENISKRIGYVPDVKTSGDEPSPDAGDEE